MMWGTQVGMGWWMGWWMVFGGVLWVAFWAAVIYLVVTVARRPTETLGERHENPIEILNRRYASGAVPREEYERIRKDLMA